MKIITAIITLFLVGPFCRGQDIENEYELKNDTLRVIVKECKDNRLFNNYYDIHGIKVANYYQIIDSLTIFLNKDNISDKVIVLSPVSQENQDTLPCELKPKKRVLLVFVSTSGRNSYRIDFLNENVILNTYDYQYNPFRGMKRTKNGFRILFEFGSIINCMYEFDFVCKKAEIMLQRRTYQCFNKGNPDLSEKKTENFNGQKYKLRNLNLNEFIHIPNLLEKK